jgi:chorismate dehydratase
MGRLRISIVQYLNTAPLVWGFTHGPLQGRYDLSFTVPSQCAEQLARGDADVAIIPAIEYQRIPGLVVLPDVAIASKHAVRSLLVVSKTPIEQALRLALDSSSRSTAALVRLLAAGPWRQPGAPSIEFTAVEPDLASMLAENDAALIIGDPALRLAERHEAGEALLPGSGPLHVYDVVTEWDTWTGKPAVLAIWAARRSAVTPELVADFQASKQYGLAHLEEIATNAAATLGLPQAHLERYLRGNIDYSLDDENLAGLQLFFEKAAAAGLIPAAGPLDFAAAPRDAGVRK